MKIQKKDHAKRVGRARDSKGRFIKTPQQSFFPQETAKVEKGCVPTDEEILDSISEMIGGSSTLLDR